MKFNSKSNLCNRVASAVLSLFLIEGIAAAAPGPDKNILVDDGQKVAFLGDSITAYGWSSPGGYLRLIQDGLAKEGVKIVPIPAGVGGNTSKDMLARLDRDVLSKHPDWMTLSCGVNDVWHGVNGVDLENYKKNITSIIDQATAAGIKVVVLTATPIGEQDNPNNQKLVAYNEFLRGLAKDRNLPIADLNANFQTVLKGDKTSANSRILTADGVHMNADGNVIMAEGCLQAFGVSKTEISQIEQQWMKEPNTAAVNCGPYEPRPEGMGITLGQFRQIEKAAESRSVNFEQLTATLWLQALGQVLQSHSGDAIINADQVKKEADDILAEKIKNLDNVAFSK